MKDDLYAFIQDLVKDPEARKAFEDAQERHKIIDQLLALRKDQKLTQAQVATAMGIRQPSLSQFESEASDPRLSTLLRYARAVNAHIRFTVVRDD